MGIRSTLAFACVAATFSVAGTAFAADPDPLLQKFADLEKKVAADTSAKAFDALVHDASAAADLYKEAEGKDAFKDRALAIVGGLTKHKDDGVCKASLITLGDIGDLRGARFLRPNLRPMDEGKVPVAVDVSIDVAKKIPDTSLVEPLLAMVDSSKNYAVAAKALDALGAFGAIKNKRERILVELTKTVMKNRPGQKGQAGGGGGEDTGSGPSGSDGNIGGDAYGNPNGGNAARWPALSAALPKALNELTGTSCNSAEDWSTMVKEHKDNLKVLFVNDGAKPPPK